MGNATSELGTRLITGIISTSSQPCGALWKCHLNEGAEPSQMVTQPRWHSQRWNRRDSMVTWVKLKEYVDFWLEYQGRQILTWSRKTSPLKFDWQIWLITFEMHAEGTECIAWWICGVLNCISTVLHVLHGYLTVCWVHKPCKGTTGSVTHANLEVASPSAIEPSIVKSHGSECSHCYIPTCVLLGKDLNP